MENKNISEKRLEKIKNPLRVLFMDTRYPLKNHPDSTSGCPIYKFAPDIHGCWFLTRPSTTRYHYHFDPLYSWEYLYTPKDIDDWNSLSESNKEIYYEVLESWVPIINSVDHDRLYTLKETLLKIEKVAEKPLIPISLEHIEYPVKLFAPKMDCSELYFGYPNVIFCMDKDGKIIKEIPDCITQEEFRWWINLSDQLKWEYLKLINIWIERRVI